MTRHMITSQPITKGGLGATITFYEYQVRLKTGKASREMIERASNLIHSWEGFPMQSFDLRMDVAKALMGQWLAEPFKEWLQENAGKRARLHATGTDENGEYFAEFMIPEENMVEFKLLFSDQYEMTLI